MPRYYDIVVTPQPKASTAAPAPAVGSVVNGLTVIASTTVNASPQPFRRWTSHPNGSYDPGALLVEFDFFSFLSADSQGLSTVTIHGVSLQDLLQAQQFAGMQISVKGGMMAGLPLADPKQAGTILQGTIFQSFGNWVGTEMTLDLVVNFSSYTYSNPGQIVLNWPANTSLKAALTSCLNVAYPTLPNKVLIGDFYTLAHDTLAFYPTIAQLASHIRSITATIQPPGVDITIQPDKTILAFDGTQNSGTPIPIAFDDLIGQPTWIDVNTISIMTVMRGDIQVGNVLSLPQGLGAPGSVQTTAASQPSLLKYRTAFTGNFLVQSVRQIGNFRDPNGASWSTVFTCATQAAYPSINLVTGAPAGGV